MVYISVINAHITNYNLSPMFHGAGESIIDLNRMRFFNGPIAIKPHTLFSMIDSTPPVSLIEILATINLY